jgi:hypothetical protein
MASSEDNPEMNDKPSRKSHFHVRSVESLLFPEAIAVTGNAKALLQLRSQIDHALRGEESYPFSEAVYQDVNGDPFKVAVKWAKSKEEMQEPVPKPERTSEQVPWAKRASRTGEVDRDGK